MVASVHDSEMAQRDTAHERVDIHIHIYVHIFMHVLMASMRTIPDYDACMYTNIICACIPQPWLWWRFRGDACFCAQFQDATKCCQQVSAVGIHCASVYVCLCMWLLIYIFEFPKCGGKYENVPGGVTTSLTASCGRDHESHCLLRASTVNNYESISASVLCMSAHAYARHNEEDSRGLGFERLVWFACMALAWLCVFVHVFIHMHIPHIPLYIYIYIYICMYVCIYIYIYIFVLTHTPT